MTGGGDDGFALPQCIRWGDEGIELVRTVRVLPGRRITAVGNFRGREVVVKLFFGPGAKRYWRRERRGARWLALTGVATPKLLGERPAPEFGGWALLFECLPGARPIAFKAPPAENDSDADGAIELLARLHQHGLTQADPHLGNFIRSDGRLDGDGGRRGRVHVIDGGGVGRMSRGSQRAGLKALAAFLAQYPPAADGWAARRLACYERARQWDAQSARLGLLRRWLAAERRRRMRRYLAKTERNCSEFKVAQSWRRRCLLRVGLSEDDAARGVQPSYNHSWVRLEDDSEDRVAHGVQPSRRLGGAGTGAGSEDGAALGVQPEGSPLQAGTGLRQGLDAALSRLAHNPEAALAGAAVLKAGNSATVFRLRLGGLPVVVKRYNVKGLAHRIRRWLKRRPLIAWRNGQRLALLGIPTAIPLALSERRWGPLVAECHLVLQDKGDTDLAKETSTSGWRPGRLEQLVALFRQLAAAGLRHGDPKASNFLVQDDKVFCIDLDGMRPSRASGADVRRFLENFQGVVRRQATSAFVAAGLIEAPPASAADRA